ncbi:MAG: putative transcriptional regulator [Myxococcaceae bacterium]|nr:putative transcriptional regulator [Myxococcaceae bacterium]
MRKERARVKPTRFFEKHPIFTFDEFVASEPARPIQTVWAVLRHHTKQGNLVRVRRGLYLAADWFDPWLLASRMAPDAVLAYDGALQLQRPWRPAPVLLKDCKRVSFLTTSTRLARKSWGGISFKALSPPPVLGKKWANTGVETIERSGLSLKVTTAERTVVDLLDQVALAPPPEQLWESFVFGRLDLDAMVDHARALQSRMVAARLGFFLGFLPQSSRANLEALKRLCPGSPVYFDRARHEGKGIFLARWNLVVSHRAYVMLSRTDFRGRKPALPSRQR